MLALRDYDVLTFDCYGTLIDWETGIRAALDAILASHAVDVPPAELLSAYGELESELEHGPHRPYRAILEDVVRGLGTRYGFTPTQAECAALPASVGTWPPFADSVAGLRTLARHYRLAVISNVDDDLFAGSARLLGDPFSEVITAQQAGSYKPSLNNFVVAEERLGVPRERWLHVAQSRFHDIAPAREYGLRSVWVNRQAGRSGATPISAAAPDWEVPDLATLAAAVEAAFAQ